MPAPGSVSRHLAGVRRGDSDAIERLCHRYFEQLTIIARQKFGKFPRRVVDEQAVANEVLSDFVRRAERGDFENVTDRNGLLPVLIRLTKDRVVDEIRRLSAEKRGGMQTRGHSIFSGGGEGVAPGGFDHFEAAVDLPAARQMLAEEIEQVLGRLPDPACREILLLRFEGFTNEQIAEQLGVSLATVERKRRLTRTLLEDMAPDLGDETHE